MTRTTSNNNLLFGLPILVFIFLLAIIYSPLFQLNHSRLPQGIILDFLITIPFLYFLSIRKRNIPRITVVSVFLVCLIVASFVIPAEHQALLAAIKYWGIPIAELAVITYLFLTARNTIAEYKKSKSSAIDFYTAINKACQKILPKRIAGLMATEVAVVYYAFFNWRTPTLETNEYTYHKKSGIISNVSALMGLALIETIVMHIVLHKWNATVALIATCLGVYACIQILALIRSIKHRPISIDVINRKIQLKYGFFNETTIDINAITDIVQSGRSLPIDGSILQFSPLGDLDAHNIIIHLDSTQTLFRIYGIEKKYTSLAFYVDQKSAFIDNVMQLHDA